MSLDNYFSQLSDDVKTRLAEVCGATEAPTEADAKAYYDYVFNVASAALGDDQVAEPMRYIISAVNGLRISDLQQLIGEGFEAEAFQALVANEGRAPLLVQRQVSDTDQVLDLPRPAMRPMLQQLLGEAAYHACASDVAYHLLDHCAADDAVRQVQVMHLLLDAGETVAAAEYVSTAEGEALRLATLTMGNGLKDGPQYVKQTIMDLPRVESEQMNCGKVLTLLLCDCVGIVNRVDWVLPYVTQLHDIIAELIAKGGHDDISVLLGIAKLRLAQNARLRGQAAHQRRQQATDDDARQQAETAWREAEQEAQQTFVTALNYLMPPLQQADPDSIGRQQLQQYWICLKICQEMGQPKAMTLIFESLVKVEQQQSEPDIVNVLNQYIDMSKLYFQLPAPLQEQFTNYSDACIALLQAYLKDEAEQPDATPAAEHGEKPEPTATELNRQLTFCNFYLTIGELQQQMKRQQESYDATTEAQIRLMRLLGALQHRDQEAMSPMQLQVRLTLSVANHMLGLYYRQQGKSQHDLSVLLRANMDLAQDCFRAYPRDGRVLHFICNAALELGDFQHRGHGLMAECNTYQNVIAHFGVLNNMQIDQQLCIDMAMLHTKCGQVQASPSIRRFKDALRNLQAAHRMWTALAQNTKNEQFRKNAEAVEQIIKQISK